MLMSYLASGEGLVRKTSGQSICVDCSCLTGVDKRSMFKLWLKTKLKQKKDSSNLRPSAQTSVKQPSMHLFCPLVGDNPCVSLKELFEVRAS